MSLHQWGRGWPLLLALLLLALLPARPARGESAGAPRVDVILLLDRSGSMLNNDPEDLTRTGAEVFLGMLDPSDRVAVIAFDTDARTVVPLGLVADGQARQTVAQMDRPTGQWTDIKAALTAAAGMISQHESLERQPAVLLFTDGKPEIQDDGLPPGYIEAMDEIVAGLAAKGVPVFSIGLGQADYDVLNRIAHGTRAQSYAATSASQVVKLFTDVLSQIKERHMLLSFEEDLEPGVGGQVRTIRVPPYTRLLTLSAVGSRGEVRLKGASPSGAPLEEAPGLRASTGANYVVYTIPNPAAGEWQIQLEGAGRVQGMGQLESAIRLDLARPIPYSQVDVNQPPEIRVTVAGDPGLGSALAVWAQDRGGDAVKLERQGEAFTGTLPIRDGQVTLWATYGGVEVTRREFRLYPTGQPLDITGEPAVAGEIIPNHFWRNLLLGALAAIAGLLGFGAWNWGRIREREELLAGRLGSLNLRGVGRTAAIGPGPQILKGSAGALARLEARLLPPIWAPLAGLGMGERKVRIYIHPAPGVRLQINGRPAGDGRLYHGDELLLGSERYTFHHPPSARRPAARPAPPKRMRQSRITLNR